MKRKISADGAHLHGCGCKECTFTDVACPKCDREYRSGCFECPRCMHEWNEGNEMAYQVHLAEYASFDRSLQQIHADGVRLGAV